MLSSLAESNLRPAFLGQVEVNSCRCNVDQTAAVIQCEIIVCLAFELCEHFLILTLHPSRGSNVDSFKLAFNVVFIVKSMGDYFELQWSDGAENKVVITPRLE